MSDDQSYESAHWPLEIRYVKEDKRLEIDWDDGSKVALSAELLRVESPSAEVQGHSPSQKVLVAGRRFVGIMEIEPVGNYAVKLKFDDMHDTGIYSWQYLYSLGQAQDEVWESYLAALEAQGLSRDPF